MKTIVVKNYEEMSKEAEKILRPLIQKKKDCVLGLATGSSPEGMYDLLVKDYEEGILDFSEVKSINLDEYYPIAPTHPQSYRYFMNFHLFDKVNIQKENTYVPDGTAKDVDAFCDAYEAKYKELGGVDVQILGVGQNGHIGFNEPAEQLISKTHLTDLKPDTIKANSRFFDKIEDVPTKAITMGMGDIMAAKKIVLLASGKQKAKAMEQLFYGEVSDLCPVTRLREHPDVTVICDEDAYSLCRQKGNK